MLQPEGRRKDSNAEWNEHLRLPFCSHRASTWKPRIISQIRKKFESSHTSRLLFLFISCFSSFLSTSFLYLTLVLSVHLSFICSLYLLFFLRLSLSKNRIINQKKERSPGRAHTHLHTHTHTHTHTLTINTNNSTASEEAAWYTGTDLYVSIQNKQTHICLLSEAAVILVSSTKLNFWQRSQIFEFLRWLLLLKLLQNRTEDTKMHIAETKPNELSIWTLGKYASTITIGMQSLSRGKVCSITHPTKPRPSPKFRPISLFLPCLMCLKMLRFAK